MDRAVLEGFLGEGLSLAEIGKRVAVHESTVGYWVKKFGLRAVNREKHASRGPVRQDELVSLANAGLSLAQIAEEVGRSKTTVRHWLREYGVTTRRAEQRLMLADRHREIARECPQHGMTVFKRRSRSE